MCCLLLIEEIMYVKLHPLDLGHFNGFNLLHVGGLSMKIYRYLITALLCMYAMYAICEPAYLRHYCESISNGCLLRVGLPLVHFWITVLCG